MINTAQKYLGANLTVKKQIIDYYNQNCIQYVKPSRKYKVKYTDNWCATFTSVIAKMNGLSNIEFPYECGVQEQVKIATEKGTFYKDTDLIKRNDLIIYDWDSNGWADHVGFVMEVKDGYIKVIEGNIKDTVGYRNVPIKSKSVKGFIRIGYSEVKEDEELRIINLAHKVIRGELGTGLERQRHLGDDFKAVQLMVNKLLK